MSTGSPSPFAVAGCLDNMATTSKEAKTVTDVTIVPRLEKSEARKDEGSDQLLNDLGYSAEFRREMSLFGVLGISFCAIGILTGMSSAFQTGLFSGGPLGLFWGWNVSFTLLAPPKFSLTPCNRFVACSCFLLPCPWPKYAVPSKTTLSPSNGLTDKWLVPLWGAYTSGCVR